MRTGGDGRRSTPAVKVATAAVALSVAVMIAAIAIVGGFRREITNKIVGFNSHLTLTVSPADDGVNTLTLTPSLRALLDSVPFITSYELQGAIPAILKTPDDFKGIYFKGSDGNGTLSFLSKNLENQETADNAAADSEPPLSKGRERSTDILISRAIASQLRLAPGDSVDTYFISDELRTRRLHIAGVFNTRFSDFDNLFACGDLSLIREIAGLTANQGSSMQIETDDFGRVEEYGAELNNLLLTQFLTGRVNRQYHVETVRQRGAHYFQWLSLLDTNVAVILTLMTIVACITLVSGMLIIILDKIRFIGIMKALGAGDSLLRRVFVLLAVRVAAIGLLIGNVFIILLLYIQDKTRFIPLDADSYYIDFVPVELNPLAILGLDVAVIAVIAIVLLLPSAFVSRIAPARVLHGE